MNSLQPILLVEDDAVDIMTIKRCFKQLNITNELLVATNGKMAFDILLNAIHPPHPCLVILDINMPIMNGLEFLNQIKKNAALKHIPVVILSSSKEEKDIMYCYTQGIAGYMLKPLEYDKFVESIRLLNNYWSMNELPL